MIESGNSTKAGLVIALQTQDIDSFTYILKNTSLDLNKFVDPGGFNIFHDFAKTIVKEYIIMPYFQILLEEFKIRHPASVLREMINSPTIKEKQTPLHLAAKGNKIVNSIQKLAKEFLKLGADPYLRDCNLQTVLHLSAAQGFVGIFVYFYYTLTLDLNDRDQNFYTALHLAVMEGHENMSIFLIAFSGNLEIQDGKGYTALHLSVFSSSYKIARHLVMNGASRLVKCNFGQNALELARSRGCNDMFKVLVNAI